MNLQTGVLAVRNKLGEIIPNRWSDNEIIQELNVSARRMTSAAQSLESAIIFKTQKILMPDSTMQFAQEYLLPIGCDCLTMARFYSGTEFPLQVVERSQVQLGSLVSGLPFYIWITKNSRVLTHHTCTGLQTIPLPPNDGGDARTIVGLYPVPNAEMPVYLAFIEFHPNMKGPFDECQIPDRFMDAWVSYAVARCVEKQSDFTGAQYYDAKHEAGTQAFIDYMVDNGQEINAPVFLNRPQTAGFLRGANTVIICNQNVGQTNL